MLIFGLVYSSLSSNKINAFVHAAADGAKGRRNALIFVLTYLDVLWIPTPLSKNHNLTTEVATPYIRTIGLELNVICENCGGLIQKNNVLRDALLLALFRSFRNANVIFLAKVHAKNAYNRAFNLMKQYYHKRQAWTCK